jgi:PTS system mannose-specific IIB component/fructoselysine and glucoselysine-specific PTS system IIB component
VPIELCRIDDRLIHGQVVVGWGQPMNVGFIVLVDDEVATSDWEQELYRMGVPPGVDVQFASVADAAARFAEYDRDPRPGILLTGDIETMARLVGDGAAIKAVNIGGVHHHPSRTQRLRYVFLTADEEASLKAIAAKGVAVSAQDVPAARVVPLDDVLSGAANS